MERLDHIGKEKKDERSADLCRHSARYDNGRAWKRGSDRYNVDDDEGSGQHHAGPADRHRQEPSVDTPPTPARG